MMSSPWTIWGFGADTVSRRSPSRKSRRKPAIFVEPTSKAMPSTGWEFSYYPQLVASNLLTVGDVGTLGVRYFDGNLSDTWSLIMNERYPITPKLRILPRLRVDWRNRAGRDEFLANPDATAEDPVAAAQAARARNGSLTGRPYFGIEWRVWKLTFSGDAGVEWTNGSFDAAGGDELSYAFSAGVRYDF